MKNYYTEDQRIEIAETLKGKLYLDDMPAKVQGFKLPFAEVYTQRNGFFNTATFSWDCLYRAISENRLPLRLESF